MKTNQWIIPDHICSWCFYHPWPYHSPGVVGHGLLLHWMLHLWIYLLVQLQSDAHEGTKQAHQFHNQPILPWESLTDLPLSWSLILRKEFGQGWWVAYGQAFGVHQCARDKDHLVVSLSRGVSQSKFSTFQSLLQTWKTITKKPRSCVPDR